MATLREDSDRLSRAPRKAAALGDLVVPVSISLAVLAVSVLLIVLPPSVLIRVGFRILPVAAALASLWGASWLAWKLWTKVFGAPREETDEESSDRQVGGF